MQNIYTQDHLVEIIVSLLKKYHAERAILFGSYARKEADSLSDIDLLVIGGPSFDSTDIFASGNGTGNTAIENLTGIASGDSAYPTAASTGLDCSDHRQIPDNGSICQIAE